MSRFALHLTCITLGLALCASPGVEPREEHVTRETLRTATTERPHLGLPTLHVSPRASVVHVFFAPGVTVTLVPASALRAQLELVEDAAPENTWRARAHPAQAPPVES